MGGWVGGSLDGWMDGWAGGRMSGRMDGQMEVRVYTLGNNFNNRDRNEFIHYTSLPRVYPTPTGNKFIIDI